jgi:hypothetical protein
MLDTLPLSTINAPDHADPFHPYHGKTGKVCNDRFFLDEGGDIPATVGLLHRIDADKGNTLPDLSAMPWHEVYTARDLHPAMTKVHEARYYPRLAELARRCGIVLKAPRAYVGGEVLVSVEHEDPHYKNTDFAGKFGQAFCDALAGVHWRCGAREYGYQTRPLDAFNGWAWLVVGDLVDALDRAGIPDRGEVSACNPNPVG